MRPITHLRSLDKRHLREPAGSNTILPPPDLDPKSKRTRPNNRSHGMTKWADCDPKPSPGKGIAECPGTHRGRTRGLERCYPLASGARRHPWRSDPGLDPGGLRSAGGASLVRDDVSG